MQVQLVFAFLALIDNLGFCFNLNFVAVCIKYRSNARNILTKSWQHYLLDNFHFVFWRLLELAVLEVKLLTQLQRNFLRHLLELDAKIVNFFHRFYLQLIKATELLNFLLNFWKGCIFGNEVEVVY